MINVIESFAYRQVGGGALTVTRTVVAAGAYDSHGRALAGTTSTLPIVALVTPTEGRDLKIITDAAITEEVRVLLTGTPLKTREPASRPTSSRASTSTATRGR